MTSAAPLAALAGALTKVTSMAARRQMLFAIKRLLRRVIGTLPGDAGLSFNVGPVAKVRAGPASVSLPARPCHRLGEPGCSIDQNLRPSQNPPPAAPGCFPVTRTVRAPRERTTDYRRGTRMIADTRSIERLFRDAKKTKNHRLSVDACGSSPLLSFSSSAASPPSEPSLGWPIKHRSSSIHRGVVHDYPVVAARDRPP